MSLEKKLIRKLASSVAVSVFVLGSAYVGAGALMTSYSPSMSGMTLGATPDPSVAIVVSGGCGDILDLNTKKCKNDTTTCKQKIGKKTFTGTCYTPEKDGKPNGCACDIDATPKASETPTSTESVPEPTATASDQPTSTESQPEPTETASSMPTGTESQPMPTGTM